MFPCSAEGEGPKKLRNVDGEILFQQECRFTQKGILHGPSLFEVHHSYQYLLLLPRASEWIDYTFLIGRV